ncbi:MAG: transposase [Bdellovibrionota bacterium]
MSNVKTLLPKGKRKKLTRVTVEQANADQWHMPDGTAVNSEHMILSLLLPTNVKEFYRRMEEEIEMLCGPKGRHTEHAFSRWSPQAGSIYMGNQKVAIEKGRVRGPEGEQVLQTYARFQDSSTFDRAVFNEGLKRVSQRDYKQGLPQIASSFGFSKSQVSRSWVRSTEKKFLELSQRDLKPLDIVTVFIDGKRFSKYGVVVALGVSTSGKKYVLGVFQADTENANACLELLSELERRGLPSFGLLFIVDGGSGLNSALERKYNVSDEKRRAAVKLRCHLHKWNNIDDALDGKDERLKVESKSLFWAMRDAKDGVEARAHATSLEGVLKRANASALKSFQEAKDDLLRLHSLGLSSELKRVFSTTNPIESVNSITEEDMRRVKRWRDSMHFQPWYAMMALHAEKRMRRVKGHRGLFSLKEKLQKLCTHEVVDNKVTAA